MKIFESFNDYIINEGVYDKYIFKAIFLAGGPGSGKSYVSNKTVSGLGVKMVNSDILYEHLLKKQDMSLNIKNMNPEDFEKAMEIRKKAKGLTEKQLQLYLDGRLGMVLDGTGKDFNKISNMSDSLKNLGYDTYMIFVNTSLDTALERNEMRAQEGDRGVPDDIVVKSWKKVQSNMGKFQNYFGTNNFILVDNNNATEDVFLKVHKRIKNLLNEPVNNYKAKQWIEKELETKKR